MKHITCILSLTLFISFHSSAQWHVVGDPGCSEGYAFDISIMTDDSATPLVSYNDGPNQGPTVLKFDGNAWQTLGNPGISTGVGMNVNFDLDQNGTPYVGFSDGDQNFNPSLMKFDGVNWVYVGQPGFDAPMADFAIAPDGTPYVAGGDFDGKMTVMKFDGTDWVVVGQPNFSVGGVSFTDIEIASDGTPYVTYLESAFFYLSTKKFDGTSWVNVGTESFENSSTVPYLQLDQNNTPWVVYSDGQLKVKKFTNTGSTGWEQVGGSVFNNIPSYYSLAINAQGVPYVAYAEYWTYWKATVKSFDGTDWVAVGGTYANEDSTEWVDVVVDKFGNPYIAYKDVQLEDRLTVKKFGNLNGVNFPQTESLVQIFPNPAADEIHLLSEETNTSMVNLSIYSSEGKMVFRESRWPGDPVDVRKLSPGLYFVVLHNDKQGIVREASFVRQ